MVRGIEFRIPQERKKILWEILNCIDVSKYDWYNIQNQKEIYSDIDDSDEEQILNQLYYEGNSFKNAILRSQNIIFIKLEAYKAKTEKISILTYDEFKNSTCQILLLIYDCEFVEIFAKEQNVIDSLYENAENKGFLELDYITDANDQRTLMNVL